MSDKPKFEVGTIIDDRFEIESQLGAGGYSEILAAIDRDQDRPVALKILRDDAVASDPRAAARMRQEAAILRTLRHPNIVRVFEVGRCDAGEFLVMERIDGKGLDEVLAQGYIFDTERLLPLVFQILDALESAHSKDVLHRDLKPENILVTDVDGNEMIKLVDFGVAKATTLLDEDESDEGITLVKTRAGNFVGTPRYAAPEMIVGDPTSPATDLFCLGLVIFEALTGHPLIEAKSHKKIMNQLVLPRPFELGDVPEPWRQWLEDLVEKSPDRRLSSVREARVRLVQIFDSSEELPLEDDQIGIDTLEQPELYPAFGDDDAYADTVIDPEQPEVDEDNIATSKWEPLDIDRDVLEKNRRKKREALRSASVEDNINESSRRPDRRDRNAMRAASPRELVEKPSEQSATDANRIVLFFVVALLAFGVAGFTFYLIFG